MSGRGGAVFFDDWFIYASMGDPQMMEFNFEINIVQNTAKVIFFLSHSPAGRGSAVYYQNHKAWTWLL